MDYEKKYKEALERAKEIKGKILQSHLSTESCKAISEYIDTIIPELRESEDERIRKKCIELIKRVIPSGDSHSQESKEILDCIAYLEKQKEQKEINLVETLKHYPKETELYSPLYGKLWLAEVDETNEIITCYKYPLEKDDVRATLEQEDTVSFYSNGTTGLPDFEVSKDCMLFLYDGEKQKEQKPDIEFIQRSWYLEGYQDRKYGKEPMWIINTGEDGPKYELNPKYGKKLVEEQNLETFNEPYNPDEYEVVMEGNTLSLKRKEQKPIKDVVKDVTKNKESATKFLKSAGIMDDNGELAEIYRSERKPVEWGEKEIKHLYTLARYIKSSGYEDDGEFLEGVADKLKELRPSWKPSEEQMDALKELIDDVNRARWVTPGATELYEQLKKL